jgi:hypothetical protein
VTEIAIKSILSYFSRIVLGSGQQKFSCASSSFKCRMYHGHDARGTHARLNRRVSEHIYIFNAHARYMGLGDIIIKSVI